MRQYSITLYTYQIAVLSSIDPVASITVQILDKEIVKTTFTINAASHTQNVPTQITYKEYTFRILFKYKHLEYEYNCTMSPVGKHLPIQIANNVITIKNPNQHHGFEVRYRIHTFSSHRSGKLPLRIWISPGKHRIEFFKRVWFWHTWVQYAQWTQDFEITTYDPKISFLAEKLVTTTSVAPTTIVNRVVPKVIITNPTIHNHRRTKEDYARRYYNNDHYTTRGSSRHSNR